LGSFNFDPYLKYINNWMVKQVLDNTVGDEAELSLEDALAEQDRLLGLDAFIRSPRLSKFFRFVVAEELAGRGRRLNGTQIAIDVYDRDATFDPKNDPVVRVEARRLRRILEHYYLTDGIDNPVRIEIPKGGYRPAFRTAPDDQAVDDNPQPVDIDIRLNELPPIPNAPIIAVLPFRNLGGDKNHDYFAQGFSESLTTALTRFDILQVIAEQSTIRYQGKKFDVRVAGRELGARFILEGSIQRTDNLIRVTAALSDAADGKGLWAETFDRNLLATDLFQLEDELTQSVIAIISDINGVIPQTLTPEFREKQAVELTTHEAALRFLVYLNHFRMEDFLPAKEALEAAVEREPDHGVIWAGLSMLCSEDYLRGITADRGPPEKAWELANHATALAPKSPGTHLARAIAAFACRRPDIVIKEADLAIALNPNSASLCGLAGHLIGVAGELERGIGILNDVKNLNPYYPSWLLSLTCISHYMKGD
jgi:adenylate cyclase